MLMLQQIDFYILHHSQTKMQETERFVCQLVDKIWHQGYRVYIHTDSLPRAKLLDEILWTFKQDSFIPHDIYHAEEDIDMMSVPVWIGFNEKMGEHTDVLINLTTGIPTLTTSFQRIAEIVEDTPNARQAGRDRYRFYRDKAYTLKTHEIHR
jgi:DNA polymerase-3 subunit chi